MSEWEDDRTYVVGDPAPIDWPDRFRKAAVVAMDGGFQGLPYHLAGAADALKGATPAVVEAIERPLLGEAP
jgi:hypothetical protein